MSIYISSFIKSDTQRLCNYIKTIPRSTPHLFYGRIWCNYTPCLILGGSILTASIFLQFLSQSYLLVHTLTLIMLFLSKYTTSHFLNKKTPFIYYLKGFMHTYTYAQMVWVEMKITCMQISRALLSYLVKTTFPDLPKAARPEVEERTQDCVLTLKRVNNTYCFLSSKINFAPLQESCTGILPYNCSSTSIFSFNW